MNPPVNLPLFPRPLLFEDEDEDEDDFAFFFCDACDDWDHLPGSFRNPVTAVFSLPRLLSELRSSRYDILLSRFICL